MTDPDTTNYNDDLRAAYVAKQEADLVRWAQRQNANRFFEALGYWPDNYCPDTATVANGQEASA